MERILQGKESLEPHINDSFTKQLRMEMSRQKLVKADGARLIGLSSSHFSKKLKGTYPFFKEETIVLSEWAGFYFDPDRNSYWYNPNTMMGPVLKEDPGHQLLLGSYVLYEADNENRVKASLLHIYNATTSIQYEIRRITSREYGMVNVSWKDRLLTLLGQNTKRTHDFDLQLLSTRHSVFKVAHQITDSFIGQSMISKLNADGLSVELRPCMFERLLCDVYGEYTPAFPEHLLPEIESRLEDNRDRVVGLLNEQRTAV